MQMELHTMYQYTAHPVEPEIRFWNKVNKNGSIPKHRPELGHCWEWTASLSEWGYGNFRMKGKTLKSNRLAWQFTYGDIPDGLQALHKCDNPKCCNPEHLFLGTNKDNVDDKVNKGRARGLPGESNPSHKLTFEQVKYIRERYAQGGISWAKLGKEIDISKRQVGKIIRGESWK